MNYTKLLEPTRTCIQANIKQASTDKSNTNSARFTIVLRCVQGDRRGRHLMVVGCTLPVPIVIKVMSSNRAHGRCTRYNIV
jgi:hypothetical protein